jgi:hypothetical protein
MSTRLALARTEGDPGGKGAMGEDPVKEGGAVIERAPCSSRLTKGPCVQSHLSLFNRYPSKKKAWDETNMSNPKLETLNSKQAQKYKTQNL